jgi:hypothetical protein
MESGLITPSALRRTGAAKGVMSATPKAKSFSGQKTNEDWYQVAR